MPRFMCNDKSVVATQSKGEEERIGRRNDCRDISVSDWWFDPDYHFWFRLDQVKMIVLSCVLGIGCNLSLVIYFSRISTC